MKNPLEKLSEKEIEESKYYPKGVYLCSPYNSTMFTKCCEVAICDDQQNCPSCGLYVVGWDSYNRNKTRWLYAYKK